MTMKKHFLDLLNNTPWEELGSQILKFTEKEKITDDLKRRSMFQLHKYVIENKVDTWQNIEFVIAQLDKNLIKKNKKEELFVDLFIYLVKNMKTL